MLYAVMFCATMFVGDRNQDRNQSPKGINFISHISTHAANACQSVMYVIDSIYLIPVSQVMWSVPPAAGEALGGLGGSWLQHRWGWGDHNLSTQDSGTQEFDVFMAVAKTRLGRLQCTRSVVSNLNQLT